MTQFDMLLRRALMDANLAQYERVLQNTETTELDFSPGYLRERMRFLADPWSWGRRKSRPGGGQRRLNWRLIAIVAALLLLSACAVAVVTGQFSQWFPHLGVDPAAPEVSEEVLSRTGTAIEQSQTVGDTTVTLNAAVWDGGYVWLSFTVESPHIPEEVERYSLLYTGECRLILREDQWTEHATNSTRQTCALENMTPEETEKTVQERLAEGQYDSLSMVMPEQREGDTLFFQTQSWLPVEFFTETKQPELTLHIENMATLPDNGDLNSPGEIFAAGPFDFTFTLEEPLLPIHYTGAVEVTMGEIPLRFTEFQLAATNLTVSGDVLVPVEIPGGGGQPDPDKLNINEVTRVCNEGPWGVWTEDGTYVDLTSMGGGGGGGENPDGTFRLDWGRDYPYPLDPAAMTALNVGGVRVELSELERLEG